ncbi:uncharacterized protein [Battus philenor]|uniref:uncharacterized protein n=1 Tax=Battus philenor TaxID=42288 RepID=UPI0035CF7421
MFYLLLFLIVFVSLYENSRELDNNGDKLVLQPVELIDLVIQEQMRTDLPAVRRRFKENVKSTVASTRTIELIKATNESQENIQLIQRFKLQSKDNVPSPDTWEINPSLNTMWAYRPAPISHHPGDALSRKIIVKNPHVLTRLAKTFTYGYDPYFEKDFFEPFERRPKPVTLVSFRKSGLLNRNKDESTTVKENLVAELQSPFNEIGSFWQDDV